MPVSRLVLACCLVIVLAPSAILADVPLDEGEKLKFFGDFRFQLERDWDSVRASGVERPDRDRARIRIRVGLKYDPTDWLSVAFRLRTGSNDSQQSPHITVHDFTGFPG